MKIYFILKFYNAISCIDKCTFLKCKGSLQITKLLFVKHILCEGFVLYKKEQNRTQNSKKYLVIHLCITPYQQNIIKEFKKHI